MKKSLAPVALIFPNPVLAVATYDENGRANVATLAWGGIASSEPPAITIAVQKSRATFAALNARKAFTANLVPARYAAEADYFGLVSGKNVDKFAAVGLTPKKSELVDAPYIDEFAYALECEVSHVLDLGRHSLFVGQVKGVLVDEGSENLWEGVEVLSWNAATREYLKPGEFVAKAFDVGRKFMK